MSRTVKEWVGKTDDAKIPPRVRQRVYDRYNGICHLSGIQIRPGMPWDCDHIQALINGGEHRESNLAPALRDKHREKTAEDVAEKSKTAAVRGKHTGARQSGTGFATNRNGKFKRKMDGTVVPR